MAKKSANPPFATTAKSGSKKAGKSNIRDITERKQLESSFRFQPNRATLAALVASTILITVISIFCLSSGYFTIFQNLFYIPIIIACAYYTKRGFVFSVFIAGTYFFLILLFTRDSATLLEAFIRVLIFVLIAGLITYLSLMRKRSEQALQQGYEYLEDMVRERTAQLEENIAESKRAERNIMAEKQLSEQYLNIAEVILVAFDDQARITMINRKGCQLLGYERGELLGKDWFKVCLPPEEYEQVFAVYKKIIVGEIKPFEYYENSILKKNGEKRLIAWHNTLLTDANGRVTGTLSSGEDITERKRAEDALRESEAKFKRMYDSNIIGVIFFDTAGNIIQANEEFLRIVGYTKEDILSGKVRWKDMTPPEYAYLDEKALEEMAETGVSNPFEKEYIHKDGSRVPILINAALLKEKGDVGLCFIQDISERKKVDELKDQFLNTTSHELKSPLIPIKSQCQLLLDGDYGALNEGQKEAVEMIHKNENYLERLVTDILDIAKARSNKLPLIFEKADIGKIVSDSLEGIRGIADEKGITLNLEVTPKLPKIFIDSQKITQVIANLLNNAIRFTPEKETVDVAIGKTKDDIEVSIHDTGIGMDKRTLEKIFTPFFQADAGFNRKYGGSGLGLSICEGIIKAHGGKIWGSSEGKNRGSTFTFTLPLKREKTNN